MNFELIIVSTWLCKNKRIEKIEKSIMLKSF